MPSTQPPSPGDDAHGPSHEGRAMSAPSNYAPQCHACSAYLEPPGHYCPACQAPQPQMMQLAAQTPYRPPVAMVSAKSPGIAVLLSFLWLGAGHLYANQTTAGVLLIVFDAFLWLISFTFVGL